MNEHEKGQVASSAAEIYEQFFVPALFGNWPPQILDVAGVQIGESVLDIACGTGIVALEATQRVGPTGSVTGLDINDGMLAVAKTTSAEIDWKIGAAESLPFDDNEFDHVVCQFGLMFFQDRIKAISEMLRVMHPAGRGCVAVWADLSSTPGYQAVAKMLTDVFNAETAKSIEAPYCLGDIPTLESLFKEAGAHSISIQTRPGKARFESLETWIYTDIKGWTLAEIIDDAGYQRLKNAAPEYLNQFTLEDGRVEFDAPAHLVTFSAS